MLGRDDIPVAAGAPASLTGRPMGQIQDPRLWQANVPPRPAEPGAALELLEASVDAGATVVAIGPYTNLGLLEAQRPGHLARVPVVAMGGWLGPQPKGFPQSGPEEDWNVQCDPAAALALAAHPHLTLVPLAVTTSVTLRAAHLPRLEATGGLGRLLARQSRAHGNGSSCHSTYRPTVEWGVPGVAAAKAAQVVQPYVLQLGHGDCEGRLRKRSLSRRQQPRTPN